MWCFKLQWFNRLITRKPSILLHIKIYASFINFTWCQNQQKQVILKSSTVNLCESHELKVPNSGSNPDETTSVAPCVAILSKLLYRGRRELTTTEKDYINLGIIVDLAFWLKYTLAFKTKLYEKLTKCELLSLTF